VISRVLQKGQITVARPDLPIYTGDVLLAVGPKKDLVDLQLIVGGESTVDLRTVPSKITTRNALVTHRSVLGKTVDEVDLERKLGVTITRVTRSGFEFTAVGDLRLQFGDNVRLVGEPESIAAAAKVVGDSVRDLNLPRLLPIFFGIALGVVLGSIPVFIPGLPAPIKLGLASGPMIVAIILARLGRVGRLIYYMPHSASGLLRELGIVLFLIAVGLRAGPGFFDNLFSFTGVKWLMLGALITLLPLLIVGFFAKKLFKMNYLHVCGLLAGSMTSPSLAFTHTMTSSEAPAVAFATVYPLTMIMRVLVAQLMILIFVR
jgi:putative transport protein